MEVSFGQGGLECFFPGGYDPPRHKHSFLLGCTRLSPVEVALLLMELEETWQGKDYNLLNNNGQTFAVDFCQRLGLAENVIPKKYRTFAGFDWALCCRPKGPTRMADEELSWQSSRSNSMSL